MTDPLMIRLTALPASDEAMTVIKGGLLSGRIVWVYLAVGDGAESILAYKMRPASGGAVDTLNADDRQIGFYPDARRAMEAGEVEFKRGMA